MAQLSAAIDGIAEACTALGTPITGGNVSLYNETRGVGINPTPVLGIVGIIDDVTKSVPAHFQHSGDAIILLWPVPRGENPDPNLAVPFTPVPISPYIVYPLTQNPGFPVASPISEPISDAPPDAADLPDKALRSFGSSEYASVVLHQVWGTPPSLDLDAESDLHTLLAILAKRKLLCSACDVSDGGIAVALAQAAFTRNIGATIEQDPSLMVHPLFGLFAEPASTLIVTTDPSNVSAIAKLAGEYSYMAARIGATGGNRLEISVYGDTLVSAPLADLRKIWSSSLEANIHDEVPA
jgi:phosphoribosylformylglycinamidine synthase